MWREGLREKWRDGFSGRSGERGFSGRSGERVLAGEVERGF